MIDRTARDRVAEVARHYVAGISTNFALDDALFELESNDPCICAIRKQLWLIYDDLREHRNNEQWALTSHQREVITRIIMFLKTDIEYRWPTVPGWYAALRPILRLLTLGAATQVLDERYAFQDNDDVWPFRSQSEIQEARNDPKYLAAAT